MAAAGNNPAVLSPETLPMYHVKKRKEVRKGDSPIPFAGTTSISYVPLNLEQEHCAIFPDSSAGGVKVSYSYPPSFLQSFYPCSRVSKLITFLSLAVPQDQAGVVAEESEAEIEVTGPREGPPQKKKKR